MATIPDIYNKLVFLRRNLSTVASQSGQSSSSIIVPVASATLSAYTNSIYMDHDRLPPMQPFTIGTETVNAHDLNSEFMYICMSQFSEGSFYLVGDSGLFSLGFSTLAITPSTPAIIVDVIRPDFTTYSFTINGCEQRSVFLAKGDSFRMLCTLPEETETHTLNGLMSNFTITRTSKNAGYTHPLILG